jgi:hypothetical protein
LTPVGYIISHLQFSEFFITKSPSSWQPLRVSSRRSANVGTSLIVKKKKNKFFLIYRQGDSSIVHVVELWVDREANVNQTGILRFVVV